MIDARSDWDALGSSETYLGNLRGERRSKGHAHSLGLNEWTLAGDWAVGEEAAVLQVGGGALAYRFRARDVNLVLTPPASGAPVPFVVRIDGMSPGAARGVDIDEAGEGVVSEPRMYQLVRRRGSATPHTFKITFLDAGVGAYVFTFG